MAAPKLEEDSSVGYDRKVETKKGKKGRVGYIGLGLLSLALLGWITVSLFSTKAPKTTKELSPEPNSTMMMTHEESEPKPINAEQSKISESYKNELVKEAQQLGPAKDKNLYEEVKSESLIVERNPIVTKKTIQKVPAQENVNSKQIPKASQTENFEIKTHEVLMAESSDGPESKINQAVATRESKESAVATVAQLEPVAALNSESAINQLTEPRIIEMVVVTKIGKKHKSKKSGWKKLLTPQSYDDINLGKTLASQSLKSAVEDVPKHVVPETLLTK